MAFIITYETLFDLLRKEKSREDLQALPCNFYHDILEFMKKKETSTKLPGAQGQRALIEYNNIKKILKELYERRERKTLLLALNKARTESAIIDSSILLPQEKGLFEELVQALKMNKRAVIESVFNLQTPMVGGGPVIEKEQTQKSEVSKPETPAAPTPKSPNKIDLNVKFLVSIPKFLGKDMKVFGPFNEGDTAKLPNQIANILIKKGRAEEI